MSEINVTLNWQGIWEIKEEEVPNNIPDEEGVYMVICGKASGEPNKWDPDSYKLIYIGEAEKIRTRILEHNKWSCWKKNCQEHILLKVVLCKIGEEKRRKVECCLIYHTKPVCNDECKDSFPHENDVVKISNTGMKAPLKDNYTCRGSKV